MRKMLTARVILVLVAACGLAATVALSTPAPLPQMTSVSDAFNGTDFSDVPPKQHFTARDGTRLDFRAYPGDPARVVVLVHGSSGTSGSMHLVAKAIRARGATVYAIAMRGHDGTGRSVDVDYIGQLDDDVVDFVKTRGPRGAGGGRARRGGAAGG